MNTHSTNTMKPLSILAILFLVIAVSHANTNTNTNSDDNNQDESSNLGHNNNPLIRLPTHTSDLDLTQLLNRHRVNLRNRYRVPLTRYVPRRCRHRGFTTFTPGVRVDPRDDLATIMKKQAEFIRHRHVADKFDPIKLDAVYELKGEYNGEWKAGRRHHHHDHDDDDHSDDSDDEGHNKAHGHEVYAHRFNHHGHKKKGNYIMRNIRKFLSYYF